MDAAAVLFTEAVHWTSRYRAHSALTATSPLILIAMMLLLLFCSLWLCAGHLFTEPTLALTATSPLISNALLLLLLLFCALRMCAGQLLIK